MKITTKDLIQLLPFEEAFKASLLADFDNLSADQRANIADIVWDTYAAVYQIRLDKNTREALVLAETGQKQLDSEFYKKIREKTNSEMQSQLSQVETTVDLSEAREELQKIMNGSSKQTN